MNHESNPEQALREIARRQPLSPRQARRVWARATAIRGVLIRLGLATTDELNAEEDRLLLEYEERILKTLKQTTGAEDEQGSSVPVAGK